MYTYPKEFETWWEKQASYLFSTPEPHKDTCKRIAYYAWNAGAAYNNENVAKEFYVARIGSW